MILIPQLSMVSCHWQPIRLSLVEWCTYNFLTLLNILKAREWFWRVPILTGMSIGLLCVAMVCTVMDIVRSRCHFTRRIIPPQGIVPDNKPRIPLKDQFCISDNHIHMFLMHNYYCILTWHQICFISSSHVIRKIIYHPCWAEPHTILLLFPSVSCQVLLVNQRQIINTTVINGKAHSTMNRARHDILYKFGLSHMRLHWCSNARPILLNSIYGNKKPTQN